MTTIKVEHGDLVDIVTFAARALPKSAAVPTLLGMRLVAKDKTLTVSAFDYDTFAAATAKTGAGAFDVLVPGLTFARYVAALPGGLIEVKVEDKTVSLSVGKRRVTLRTMTATDYPTGPDAPDEVGTVGADLLADAMAGVRACVDPAAPIQVLRGCFMDASGDTMGLIGADARHAAQRTIAWSGKPIERIAIPLAVCDAAKSFTGDVTLGLDAKLAGLIGLNDGTHTIVARLIAGDIPKIEQALNKPKPDLHVTVTRAALIDAVKFAAVGGAQDKEAKSVQVTVTEDSLSIALVGSETHDALSSIDAEVEGNGLDFRVHPIYLLQALEVTDAERVTLGIQSPAEDKPVSAGILINGVDDDASRALVMPKAK